MKPILQSALLVFLLSTAASAADQAPSATGPLETMPKDLEVKFALSALPPHLREQAGVYLLDPAKGYSLARKGSNGFNCLVERTEWARADFRNDIFTALCYDAEGSKNHLKVWTDVAEMRAQGRSAEQVRDEVRKRFKTKVYKAPAHAGLSYMVAPLMRTYPSPNPADMAVVTMSMPHVMYYAPNVTWAAAGAAPPPSPYPFVFEEGPQGYLIQLIGETERNKIIVDEKTLLAELCSYKSFLCLNPQGGHNHE